MSDLKNEQSEKSGVGGWLLLLCFALTIGSPLGILYNLITSYDETSTLFDLYPGLQNLLYIDGFLSTVLMLLSIRAGIALWTIKPNAVKTAKNYFWIFLGYSVVAIFLPFIAGLPSEVNVATIPEVIKGFVHSLVYFGIWYSYLDVSKRVKATYNSDISDNISIETETNEEIVESGKICPKCGSTNTYCLSDIWYCYNCEKEFQVNET